MNEEKLREWIDLQERLEHEQNCRGCVHCEGCIRNIRWLKDLQIKEA